MSGNRRGPAAAKQKWTEEEEAALRAGVDKYDVGKWRHIQKDEVFGPILKSRSNVDLKDKWRNLNMDTGGSRRDHRGSGEKGSRRKKRRRQDVSSGPEMDGDEEYVVRRSYTTGRRRIPSRRALNRDVENSVPDVLPSRAEVTVESVLAAMIQLQDPDGSTEDTVIRWLQENYEIGPESQDSVVTKLTELIETGRVTNSEGLYKLAGFPQQLVEESRQHTGSEEEGGGFSWSPASSRAAREAAEAAAKAVAEAEEAAELAAELIAAADKYHREAVQDELPDENIEKPSEEPSSA